MWERMGRNYKEVKKAVENLRVDMTGARYLVSLRNKQDTMKQEIIEFCRNHKSRTIITASEIYEEINSRYPMPEEEDETANVILQGIIRNLLLSLVTFGELEEKELEKGIGYICLSSSQQSKKEVA